MKKNTTITFLILLSIIISADIKAEDFSDDSVSDVKSRSEFREDRREERRDEIKSVRASSTKDIKVLREKNQEDIKKMRADFKNEVKSNTASTSEVVKEKRAELIKAIQEKRDIFKEEFDTRRTLVASTTADIKAKFKADLVKIKDEKKKEKIENVGNNLIELNTKITTKSSERVNKIEEVLIALESRADKSAVEGMNMANVLAHIANSEALIAEARTAISVQVAKTYSVTITDEATAKASIQSSRDLLKKDVEAMNVKIKAAHDATKKAIEAYRSVVKVKTNATSTSN